jgi:hypothetical protein
MTASLTSPVPILSARVIELRESSTAFCLGATESITMRLLKRRHKLHRMPERDGELGVPKLDLPFLVRALRHSIHFCTFFGNGPENCLLFGRYIARKDRSRLALANNDWMPDTAGNISGLTCAYDTVTVLLSGKRLRLFHCNLTQ